jgi:Asp/Glu/hydantoin racemase
VNNITASAFSDIKTSPPFSRFIDSSEFSDISFRVIEEEEEILAVAAVIEEEEEKKEKGVQGKIRICHGHKNILAAISPWFKYTIYKWHERIITARNHHQRCQT